MGTLGGSQGFTPPLKAGDYTIWLNQTGPMSCASLQFVLTADNQCPSTLNFTNETINSGTYKAADTIKTIGNVLIGNNNTVNFEAGKSIQLNSGFSASAGSNFSAIISNCGNAASSSFLANELNQSTFDEVLEQEISLKISPNPFHSTTSISYQLSKFEKISLRIYDLSGKLVKTLVNSKVQPDGYYQYNFQKEGLKKGMYILVLTTATTQLSNKLVLLD